MIEAGLFATALGLPALGINSCVCSSILISGFPSVIGENWLRIFMQLSICFWIEFSGKKKGWI